MFEAQVLHLLRRYLGEYVHDFSSETLRISVWQGDVVLKDLKLKTEALNALNIPVAVKAGLVGTITLKVPWKCLGNEPVIVLVDRVFVLAHPAPDGRTLKEEEREKLFEAKVQQIEEAESATLGAISGTKQESPPLGNSWLGSMIATIIGNLKITISNVHIRYEDCLSNPGHPFSSGVTLAKLAAVTMDEQGNETFDTSGALDKLRKSLQLERLAMYHNSDNPPWKIDKDWEDLTPEEWIEVFEDGINEPSAECEVMSMWAMNRNYLVSPINGVLKYHRLGNQERNDPDIPFEKGSLVLSDVSLTITEAQYHDWIKLLEVFSRYRTYVENSHLRPAVPISKESYVLWWRYAALATLHQRKMCYRFSWDQIQHMCQLRRRYIHLYASLLQQSSRVDNLEVKDVEKDLDSKVILLWRLLAHAKVESVKSKEAAEQRRLHNKSWFMLRWSTQSEDAFDGDSFDGSPLTKERLSSEEWRAVNKLLSYQPDEDLMTHSVKDMQNMIRFLVTVSINRAATKIININQTEIVCGRFEQLHVSAKFKHRSTYCDVVLRFYGVSSPEGSLAQSVCSEQKVNALTASLVHSPVGENVHWKLSAIISPCHVTVLKESCDRFFEFMKRSNAVSPTVTSETATKLQTKIEKVTRRAHEQFQLVLEEQSRFALDIDLDAPKVRIPLRARSSSKCDSHFLLDFGHFTLHTMESQSDEQRQDIYSHFYISGRDIAAFFTDCGSDSENCSLAKLDSSNESMVMCPVLEKVDNFYSLIDRCGMEVIVDQIKIPHPSLPTTLVSVQVPNLGIHFSPARYCRLMELLNILYVAMDPCVQPGGVDVQAGVAPWSVTDLATHAKILIWRGIGNSVASWQPCFLVLSGFYIYVLDSEKSQNHLRHLSMAGRQVHEVPSTYIVGSPFCIAVSPRGMDTQKALESTCSWVIEFRGEEEKVTWLRGLIQATYKASAPPSVHVPGETSDGVSGPDDHQTRNSKAADLVINGAVVETKLCIYGKTGEDVAEKLEEQLILEVLASGGKVKMISSASELVVKTKLHSLQIKDELQGRLSGNPQYLAYSVLKYDSSLESNETFDLNGNEMSGEHIDDNDYDAFEDAMSEFISPTDSDALAQYIDTMDASRFDYNEMLIHEQDLVPEKELSGDTFYDAQCGDDLNFVSVIFSKKGSGSPVYDGIDTQMSIRMSKLEFFCNRPTLVAMIGFGFDLGSVSFGESIPEVNETSKDKMDKEKAEESGRIEGLLGYDKDRVVFYLNMDIDSVTVLLNKEDGSQLAIFVQESFLFDFKVHPTSISIEGTLGNMRLRDMSLGKDNWLGWLCDIRNPGVESLIKFKFNSFSAGDDDYEGYNYRLCGRLSAVRIVFLYRFVQEITVYFMELATPHTEEVIKLVDKVGDFEWLIQKSEIDGAAALKLDLTLDTPIIIVPKNSTSNEFVQLDVGLLKVRNKISWHGLPEKDPSAVHLDILHAEFLGVNMFVGIDGCIGKPLIRESRGLDVYVRRSLRDVFKKVPTFSLEVKFGFLHSVMSNKEYDVIRICTSMNLNETPRLPPSFRGSKSVSKDTMKLLADKVNLNSQILLSRSVTILAVEVNYALLELCNVIHEESPLAQIALEGLWVSYRMTSLSETDLYVTIPTFSVLDIRPNTKPEMRLMLGSSTDASKQTSTGNFPCFLNRNSFSRVNFEAGIDLDVPISTMFLMDYRWRMSSQSLVLRLQQPRVLVVPDFLLALGEFFVPSLGAITGREETMDPKNDPISKNNSIILAESVYKQNEDVVHLSRSRQLVADTHGIDEYTYDGCGKTIVLSEENEEQESHPTQFCPIVIIGCCKRLRFVNVKIENGSLLRKYTYLSNDSSYSVLPEDDVDLVFMDNLSSDDDDDDDDDDDEKIVDHMELINTSNTPSQDGPDVAQNFTFEAQVVAPEFTFFDGTKSCLEYSSYGEKLLRAKMDLNFMYAYKENDTWIRVMGKDLTVEAGSGLIILDPLDISGGYTSIKQKTNISLISTDICIHLSLGSISLLLNLQNQATSALQIGNAIPLAPCINFDRIWVSPKENGSHNNLTIWRPQAPSNYVILGDCVTSRPIPPSQAVLAVSNTYGRVRKPVGFKLVGFLSCVLGLEDVDSDCSLWMPVSPEGYISMGCVANIGNHPPPTHVVYCLRSDLVTSTTYSECLLNSPPNQHFTSGFSIWRLENVLGSFYAHSSTAHPSKENSSDLSHLLLWNSVWSYASLEESAPNFTTGDNYASQRTSFQTASPSRWDVLRSISKATSCYMSTPHFERMWWDKGGGLRKPVSIWRPISRPGYGVLGDCVTEGLEPPPLGIIFKSEDPEISARPVQFTKVAHIMGKGFDEVFFWYPIAPPGYVSLGCVVSRIDEAPCMNFFCCPRMDLVNPTNIIEVPISKNMSSKACQCWSIWNVENQACTFLARSDTKIPSTRLAYAINDSVKPKTRENVNAEIKLRFVSLTVLDSLHGMMTPLFDVTITNIKLVTHGRLEAMNAVLISSIAASTFNMQLEAWEPLVEPFDGIFKLETYDTSANSPSILGKRIHIAATNIVNINISAMNIETLVETILSWRRQLDFDQKATKLIEEASADPGNEVLTFSALDEEDLQTVVVENNLGNDLFIKRIEQNSEVVDRLHHGDVASVWVPPARFSDRLNVAEDSRQARYYVAAQILFAKDLPIVDDGNSHNFFCALRLIIDSQATDQQKLFPQSARTKCVKPLVSDMEHRKKGIAKWNELFIFDVPQKAVAKLEVEVTNLSAKAGKGEVVGALSFSVGNRANTLKKISSTRMLHPQNDTRNIESYSLRRKSNNLEDMRGHVKLFVSTSYYERNTTAIFQRDAESSDASDNDIGFWVRLGSESSWESVRSLLPLSVVPKPYQSEFIAMEVVMKNGKKHAIFRGLATVVNDSDVNLEISLCHVSMIHDSGSSTQNIVVEEIFENQRYHPISGWGNKWSGFRGSDPACWSTKDFSHSSKDFFEPALPNGWEWISTWTIDKSQFVDEGGWAYGADYPNQWPLTSSKSHIKSSHDVVRRRRWIRTRQLIVAKGKSGIKSDFTTISPGCSTVLPCESTSKASEQCLRIRPRVDYPQPPYAWGHIVVVAVASSFASGKDQPFVDQLYSKNNLPQGSKTPNVALLLNQIEKKDILLCCCSTIESSQIWLSVGADASALHTELNQPIYDWNISVNSPLKLENRLSCPAEFTIWERTKERNYIEREHGIISSRNSAHIYTVDIQRTLYLSFFVQGDWVLEKDPVPILDLSSSAHISFFWMFHKQSKRRLRVSVERDMGGTTAAPKTIRFFVPYWIINGSSLPLAYQVVEIEGSDNADTDLRSLSRAVKSARTVLRTTSYSAERRYSGPRRNIQVLESIEDTSPIASMLSPQDSAGRSGVTLFTSQKDTYVSPRVGIAVALQDSEIYSPGISLLELEKKERVDVKAFGSDGSYYKLSAIVNMTSDRTKVIHLQPYMLFVNRFGLSICLQQCGSETVAQLLPTDPPKLFRWQRRSKVELLKLWVDGYGWSTPFSVSSEGVMRVSLKKDNGSDHLFLKVEVRSGTKSSRYEVIFRPNTSYSPYRIENRSIFLPIQFKQVDGTSDSWHFLLPNTAVSFLWEDLGRRHLLEILAKGADPSRSYKYNIDEVFDHQPINVSGLGRGLRVTVVKEEKVNVVKIRDWMPENESTAIIGQMTTPSLSELSRNESHHQQLQSTPECEFHFIFELAELGVSIIDHTPEEILYMSLQIVHLAYSSGLGSGLSRFKLRMRGIQMDNQLPLTPTPVLFRPQRVEQENDYILKISVTLQTKGSLDLCVYPYIGFHGPDNSAFLINIHEPIIWRIHEMMEQVNLSRLDDSKTTAVSVDPIIQIGILNISEVRLKVSMAMSPSQRPRGVLGFWSSLMTALGNTENMTVRINQRFHENVCMRQSTMTSNAISNIQNDLLGQPLQLLSGLDILSNASSALGHMSKGVAALSMDKKFIQSRQRQESKGVEDLGDVIREGGGALAKGLFRGVTGILTKPLEGAKSSGVEGFVQGVGKGIIGVAAQPVSGVLDLLSKTTEGANAMRLKIASAIASDDQILRRRLPRVVTGDSLLRPFDDYKARGQVILHLAQSGSFFVDLFKVRGKFALSDSYEDHFLLPKGKILMVTHRRVTLLQQTSHITQRKFNPMRDPCSVLWDVLWDDLKTMELARGKKDLQKAPPSRLVLHLKSKPTDTKEQVRIIKCNRGTHQTLEVYSSVERTMITYGRNLSKELLKKATKPYAPVIDGTAVELTSKEGASTWGPK